MSNIQQEDGQIFSGFRIEQGSLGWMDGETHDIITKHSSFCSWAYKRLGGNFDLEN
jgi:hypothetical protein